MEEQVTRTLCNAVHEEESAAYKKLVTCLRFAGHDGDHENFYHDLAWSPAPLAPEREEA